MKTALRSGFPAVFAAAATAGLLLGTVPETTRAGKPIAEACLGCAPSPEDIIAARSAGKSLPKRTVRHAGWRNLGPDLGAVWAPINIDPGGSGTIYTGSVGGGVRRSTDNGVTWSAVNDGLAPRAIYSLAVDAAGPEIVYAGAFSPNAAEPSGVYKSSDGGASWTLQPEGLRNSVLSHGGPTHPGAHLLRWARWRHPKDVRRRRDLEGGS